MTMSDVRAGSYCEVVSQEVPAHRCLCWEAPRHVGEHRCLCGHVWGVWDAMSYDEQRQFLGLPPRPLTMDDLKDAVRYVLVMGGDLTAEAEAQGISYDDLEDEVAS